MNVLLCRHFDLNPDPWRDRDIRTADATRAGDLVRAAAGSQLLVSIAGERGAGKTRAVRAAVRSTGCRVVEPLRLDRERLHLGDVQDAIVSQLSDERPRRSGEARSGQVRRILGGATGAVLLWIDDAHLLHPSTLRGLKRLRELSWRGRGPLLGIVLTGQVDRTAGIPEVGLRTDRIRMTGLSEGEARAAIDAALEGRSDGAAAARLAESDRARNWLDLGALLDDCLSAAFGAGAERVTDDAVTAVLGAGRTPDERAPAPAHPPGAVAEHLAPRAA